MGTVMWVKLKKIVLSLSVIVLFALYALQKQTQPAGGRTIIAASLPTTTIPVDERAATSVPTFVQTRPTAPALAQTEPTVSGFTRAASTMTPTASAPSPTVSASRTPSPGSAISTTASGTYRDGSYTGIQADAHWGTVEVLAVISNGQISDAQFTEYPNHRSRSLEINRQAMPILMREAIQSQQLLMPLWATTGI